MKFNKKGGHSPPLKPDESAPAKGGGIGGLGPFRFASRKTSPDSTDFSGSCKRWAW